MTVTIFTDGASRGNPGRGGWGALISYDDTVLEIGGREDGATNNRMEMRALLEALRNVVNQKDLVVYTDSKYLINGITKWSPNWKKNDWKTKEKKDVLNRDLWEELLRLSEGKEIKLNHVEGHVGIPANERVDVIASSFADEKAVELFDGRLEEYKVDLNKLEGEEKKSGAKSDRKDRSRMKAYSYLSLVEGKVKKYQTWAECEAEVKGKANVKFRKAVSEEDEQGILEDWGVN